MNGLGLVGWAVLVVAVVGWVVVLAVRANRRRRQRNAQ